MLQLRNWQFFRLQPFKPAYQLSHYTLNGSVGVRRIDIELLRMKLFLIFSALKKSFPVFLIQIFT